MTDTSNPFKVEYTITEDEAVQRIHQWQTVEEIERRTSIITIEKLTASIGRAFQETLEVWCQRRVILGKFHIKINDYEALPLREMLQSVNEACVFERIVVEFRIDRANYPEDLVLLSSFEANNRLRGLELRGLHLTEPNLEVLRETLGFSETLRELSLYNCSGVIWSDALLCDALASNTSLEEISLHCYENTDSFIAALVSHRKLKKLYLKVGLGIPSAWAGISELLSSTESQLENLSILYSIDRSRRELIVEPMEPLVLALGQNKLLKSISLRGVSFTGELPFCTFLHAVQSHPALHKFIFSHMFTADDIRAALDVAVFQRHVTLDFHDFRLYNATDANGVEAALLDLLKKQPKLYLDNCATASMSWWHQCCLHMQGRYLINEDVPEGLWPLIWAKVNRGNPYIESMGEYIGDENTRFYRESAIYEHLRSTGFLGLNLSPPGTKATETQNGQSTEELSLQEKLDTGRILGPHESGTKSNPGSFGRRSKKKQTTNKLIN